MCYVAHSVSDWRDVSSSPSTHLQGITTVSLSCDDSLLAVHHADGVDIHRVAAFMQKQPPVQTLCPGETPRSFSW